MAVKKETFQAKSLRGQSGNESHYVDVVQPTSDKFYHKGELRDCVGIWKRVERPDGVTSAELVEVIFGTDEKLAEAIADEKLKSFSKGKKSDKDGKLDND